MSDYTSPPTDSAASAGTTGSSGGTGNTDSGHRAPGLAILGIAALLVAAWGLADGPTLPDAGTIGWIAVIVGVVGGLVLILAGARSGRR